MGTTNQSPTEMTPEQLEELAAQLVQRVRSIRNQIPGFTLPHATLPVLTGPQVTVSGEAIDAAFNACAANDALAMAVGASDVMKEHHYATAFAKLRGDAGNFAEGLDYTIRVKRHRVGTAMRRLYRIAQRMVKSPENAVLRSNVEVMARALARTRRKAAEPAPGPVVPPAGGSTSGSKQ